jgi:hypothetical protein
MKRILFYSLAASAVCAMVMSSADAATRKHHPAGHYKTAAAKLKTVSSHQLLVGEPAQTSVGRSIAGEGSIDRDGWRHADGNWDNTCFRTLSYLPSASACSGGGN